MGKFVSVAKLSDLRPQTGFRVEVEGVRIALFSVDGEVRAIADTCSHAEASLSEGEVQGEEVVCPWHAARFNLKTGEATCPPAYEGVTTYNVRVRGDDVEVEV
jgi:3-phenylpropionate/trans-cinnamate dioxygenase ferredoxin subunit